MFKAVETGRQNLTNAAVPADRLPHLSPLCTPDQ